MTLKAKKKRETQKMALIMTEMHGEKTKSAWGSFKNDVN